MQPSQASRADECNGIHFMSWVFGDSCIPSIGPRRQPVPGDHQHTLRSHAGLRIQPANCACYGIAFVVCFIFIFLKCRNTTMPLHPGVEQALESRIDAEFPRMVMIFRRDFVMSMNTPREGWENDVTFRFVLRRTTRSLPPSTTSPWSGCCNTALRRRWLQLTIGQLEHLVLPAKDRRGGQYTWQSYLKSEVQLGFSFRTVTRARTSTG